MTSGTPSTDVKDKVVDCAGNAGTALLEGTEEPSKASQSPLENTTDEKVAPERPQDAQPLEDVEGLSNFEQDGAPTRASCPVTDKEGQQAQAAGGESGGGKDTDVKEGIDENRAPAPHTGYATPLVEEVAVIGGDNAPPDGPEEAAAIEMDGDISGPVPPKEVGCTAREDVGKPWGLPLKVTKVSSDNGGAIGPEEHPGAGEGQHPVSGGRRGEKRKRQSTQRHEEDEGPSTGKRRGRKPSSARRKSGPPSTGETDTATPPGPSIVGHTLRKVFGDQTFGGTVTGYDRKMRFYQVTYEDEDQEELEWAELLPLLTRGWKGKLRAAGLRTAPAAPAATPRERKKPGRRAKRTTRQPVSSAKKTSSALGTRSSSAKKPKREELRREEEEVEVEVEEKKEEKAARTPRTPKTKPAPTEGEEAARRALREAREDARRIRTAERLAEKTALREAKLAERQAAKEERLAKRKADQEAKRAERVQKAASSVARVSSKKGSTSRAPTEPDVFYAVLTLNRRKHTLEKRVHEEQAAVEGLEKKLQEQREEVEKLVAAVKSVEEGTDRLEPLQTQLYMAARRLQDLRKQILPTIQALCVSLGGSADVKIVPETDADWDALIHSKVLARIRYLRCGWQAPPPAATASLPAAPIAEAALPAASTGATAGMAKSTECGSSAAAPMEGDFVIAEGIAKPMEVDSAVAPAAEGEPAASPVASPAIEGTTEPSLPGGEAGIPFLVSKEPAGVEAGVPGGLEALVPAGVPVPAGDEEGGKPLEAETALPAGAGALAAAGGVVAAGAEANGTIGLSAVPSDEMVVDAPEEGMVWKGAVKGTVPAGDAGVTTAETGVTTCDSGMATAEAGVAPAGADAATTTTAAGPTPPNTLVPFADAGPVPATGAEAPEVPEGTSPAATSVEAPIAGPLQERLAIDAPATSVQPTVPKAPHGVTAVQGGGGQATLPALAPSPVTQDAATQVTNARPASSPQQEVSLGTDIPTAANPTEPAAAATSGPGHVAAQGGPGSATAQPEAGPAAPQAGSVPAAPHVRSGLWPTSDADMTMVESSPLATPGEPPVPEVVQRKIRDLEAREAAARTAWQPYKAQAQVVRAEKLAMKPIVEEALKRGLVPRKPKPHGLPKTGPRPGLLPPPGHDPPATGPPGSVMQFGAPASAIQGPVIHMVASLPPGAVPPTQVLPLGGPGLATLGPSPAPGSMSAQGGTTLALPTSTAAGAIPMSPGGIPSSVVPLALTTSVVPMPGAVPGPMSFPVLSQVPISTAPVTMVQPLAVRPAAGSPGAQVAVQEELVKVPGDHGMARLVLVHPAQISLPQAPPLKRAGKGQRRIVPVQPMTAAAPAVASTAASLQATSQPVAALPQATPQALLPVLAVQGPDTHPSQPQAQATGGVGQVQAVSQAQAVVSQQVQQHEPETQPRVPQAFLRAETHPQVQQQQQQQQQPAPQSGVQPEVKKLIQRTAVHQPNGQSEVHHLVNESAGQPQEHQTIVRPEGQLAPVSLAGQSPFPDPQMPVPVGAAMSRLPPVSVSMGPPILGPSTTASRAGEVAGPPAGMAAAVAASHAAGVEPGWKQVEVMEVHRGEAEAEQPTAMDVRHEGGAEGYPQPSVQEFGQEAGEGYGQEYAEGYQQGGGEGYQQGGGEGYQQGYQEAGGQGQEGYNQGEAEYEGEEEYEEGAEEGYGQEEYPEGYEPQGEGYAQGGEAAYPQGAEGYGQQGGGVYQAGAAYGAQQEVGGFPDRAQQGAGSFPDRAQQGTGGFPAGAAYGQAGSYPGGAYPGVFGGAGGAGYVAGQYAGGYAQGQGYAPAAGTAGFAFPHGYVAPSGTPQSWGNTQYPPAPNQRGSYPVSGNQRASS